MRRECPGGRRSRGLGRGRGVQPQRGPTRGGDGEDATTVETQQQARRERERERESGRAMGDACRSRGGVEGEERRRGRRARGRASSRRGVDAVSSNRPGSMEASGGCRPTRGVSERSGTSGTRRDVWREEETKTENGKRKHSGMALAAARQRCSGPVRRRWTAAHGNGSRQLEDRRWVVGWQAAVTTVCLLLLEGIPFLFNVPYFFLFFFAY